MLNDDAEQALHSITHLRVSLDAIVIRGARSVAAEQLRELRALAAEMDRIGASHISASLSTLAQEVDAGAASAAGTLMLLVSHARLLDRLLTLRVVSGTYEQLAAAADAACAVAGESGD